MLKEIYLHQEKNELQLFHFVQGNYLKQADKVAKVLLKWKQNKIRAVISTII